MIYKKPKRWHILLAALLGAAIVFVLHYQYFLTYLKIPIIAGNDTSGHAQLGKYYAEHIFPSVWGWAPTWLGGMPFPQFYPPLFYISVALLSKILPFLSYQTIFKFFVFVLAVSIPGLLGAIASRVVRNPLSVWLTSSVGALLLSTVYRQYDNLGVSLVSIFSVGLVTQLIGFVCLLIWLSAFLNIEHSKKSYYISIIFLTLTALSSIHVIPMAIIIFIVTISVNCRRLFRQPKILFKFYILPGLLSVLLTSFWLLSMMSVYHFMPAQSLGVTDGIGARNIWVVVLRWWAPILFLAAAAFALWWRKNTSGLVLVWSSIGVLIPAALNLNLVFHQLPLHVYRYLPLFYFSGAITAAIFFDTFTSYLSSFKTKLVCFILMVIIFIIPWYGSRGALGYNNFYLNYNQERAFDIANYLKDKSGMVSVEVVNGGRQLNYLITDLAGPALRSDYTVFAESSLDSLFYIPLRSEFSVSSEKISIRSSLLHNREFLVKDPKIMAARARKFGLTYILAKSASIKNILSKSSEFALEKDFGAWTIYRVLEVEPMIQILKYEPVALYAPLGIKGKKVEELTYILLNERLLIKNDLDLTIAAPKSQYLDDFENNGRFKTTVVSEYHYRSLEKSVEILKKYTEQNKLILLSSSDPIYSTLKKTLASNPNVIFVESSLPVPTTDRLLDILEKNKTELDKKTSEEMPVLIKSTYFPAWQQNSEPVYMATPVFTLVYTKGQVDLKFTTPRIVYLGYIVTSLTILALGAMIYHDRKK